MTSRPDAIDQLGVHHRHGCNLPGWHRTTSATMPHLQVMRCADCGAVTIRAIREASR